jgi:hypothetical protein
MIATIGQTNGYKWAYKTCPAVTIIVPVHGWYLVVYFPDWGNPVGFRPGKSKKRTQRIF